MAKGKRRAAPVKAAASVDNAARAQPKAARDSIDRSERHHAGVRTAVPRAQRLRMQPVKHSAALTRD